MEHNEKKSIRTKLSRFGEEFSKGILIPVFVLPIVGILLAFGVLLTNQAIPLANIEKIFEFGTILKNSVLSIFINLSPVFCVGIAAGMAKNKKGNAGLNAIVLFFIFIYSMNSFMKLNGLLIEGNLSGTGQGNILGVQILDMGVFLGIILGVLTAIIHNKYSDIEFSGAMRLYGGANLALLIGIPIVIILSIILTYSWPLIQTGISKMTNLIVSTGSFGVGLYGFLERILIPTGLHHLLWVPVELSSVSGSGVVDGVYLEGVRNIAMAELASSNVDRLGPGAVYLTKAMSKMFGLVGAAYAIYKCADEENKAKVKALLIPAVGAAVTAGVTEPLEFSFLFTAPILFAVHAILAGIGMAVVAILDIRVIAVSGGIEFLAMMLPAGAKGDTIKFILVGIVQIVIYYYIFRFLITKLNLKTPGRGSATKLYTKGEYNKAHEKGKDTDKDIDLEKKAELIIQGLGNKENIKVVTNCFSRLRVQLVDTTKINEEILNQTECSGIVKTKDGVQIIYGLSVPKIKIAVNKKLNLDNSEE